MFIQHSPDRPEVVFADMEKRKPIPFWSKKGFILSCLFSVVWLIFIWDYLAASAWWLNRYDLSPAELIGHLCGLLLPIVIIFLVTAYFDRSAQLAAESQQLQSYLHELVYPTEEGAVYTQNLTDALRAQIKEFRSVFAQVNQETQTVRDELNQWIMDLSRIMKQVDTQTMASVREVAGHIQNLTTMTDQANNQSAKTADLFVNQANMLAQVVTQADDKLRFLSQTLSGHTTDIQQLTQTLQSVNEKTEGAIDMAGNIAVQMRETSQNMSQSIETYEKDMAHHNERLFGNLEKVLAVFKKQGMLLDNEVQKMTNRIGVLSESLADNAQGMLKTTANALQELKGIDTQFEESTQKVQKIVSQVKEDVAVIRTDMEENVKKAQAVFPTPRHQAQTDLLQDATVILDRLQGFSVDMAHIFTPKTEDTLWEKYHAGDKAVFMRHITKMISSTQQKKILSLYETNEDFRLTITRYMAEFEGMTKKAQEGEESKLLMSVLIGSDVGRLYMVLADVLKREG